MVNEAGSKASIMLEYRVAVLEGVIDWMLSNGVFEKAIETNLTMAHYGGAFALGAIL